MITGSGTSSGGGSYFLRLATVAAAKLRCSIGAVAAAGVLAAGLADVSSRVRFCSSTPPRKNGSRKRAIAITAAGIVAATVWPAFMPR